VAVTVCVPAVDGAVYRPASLTVPIVLLPPGVPSTLQFAAVFELPVTVAANCCVPLRATVAEVGETLTDNPVPPTMKVSLFLIHVPL
jgi:hypothetical protein